MIDGAVLEGSNNFLLHYNFPSFSTGEARPNRGTSRREIGHGNLALRALKPMLPKAPENPYTIRVVSDILESNGSSSMATVCAGTLALMDAGVKLKKPVSGIAMGLITDDGSKYAVLSDILGDEDHLGDMDFKVTGTTDGITACQMDIKVMGLSYEIMLNALKQAKEGRLHILGEMTKTLSAPREDYKPHAPRIIELRIPKEFIGAVIGPGGKIIQEIQEQTGTHISITEVGDKGIVAVSSSDKAGIELALDRIRRITFMPAEGDIFVGVVKTVMPYGAFVDFHGKSGLLHVSEISHSRIENVEDVLKEGDEIKIQIVEIDKKTGKMRLSRKSIMPRPNKNQEGDAN
jgi:polyribonucleotide nucleotidyltransferase